MSVSWSSGGRSRLTPAIAQISLHFVGGQLKGATFPLDIQTACWRRTKEARWSDTRDTDAEYSNNSELHVASVARRGGGREGRGTPPQSPPLPPTLPLPYLLWHGLRLASLLGVTQSRHTSFNFPPQRLLGGPQGGHPARCHANNQQPATSSTTELTARPLRRLFPPHQLRNTPVVDHWRAGQQHTVEDASADTHYLYGVTRLRATFTCYSFISGSLWAAACVRVCLWRHHIPRANAFTTV